MPVQICTSYTQNLMESIGSTDTVDSFEGVDIVEPPNILVIHDQHSTD